MRIGNKLRRSVKRVKKMYHKSNAVSEGNPLLLFSNLCSVQNRNYTYKPGCGLSCVKQSGKHSLICPSCRTFIWHLVCLQSYCLRLNLQFPDVDSTNWSCPHCAFKKRIIKK